jgi:hypothetical protein
VKGTAELFGAELVEGSTYTLQATNAAVFSWHGATLTLSNSAVGPYVAHGALGVTGV